MMISVVYMDSSANTRKVIGPGERHHGSDLILPTKLSPRERVHEPFPLEHAEDGDGSRVERRGRRPRRTRRPLSHDPDGDPIQQHVHRRGDAHARQRARRVLASHQHRVRRSREIAAGIAMDLIRVYSIAADITSGGVFSIVSS